MKQGRLNTAAAAINTALRETRKGALEDAAAVIDAQIEAIERVLENQTARDLYNNMTSTRAYETYMIRRTLWNKILLLTKLSASINRLAWQEN